MNTSICRNSENVDENFSSVEAKNEFFETVGRMLEPQRQDLSRPV